jgi:hypothetical protein
MLYDELRTTIKLSHQIVDLERTSNYLDSSDWSVVEVFVKHLAFLSFRTLQEIKANKDSKSQACIVRLVASCAAAYTTSHVGKHICLC